jgi:hypothetical protein
LLSEAKPNNEAFGKAVSVEVAMSGFACGSAQPTRQSTQRRMYLPAQRHPLG